LQGLVTTDARTGQPVLQLPLPPPEVLKRGAAALHSILKKLGGENDGAKGKSG
jgi:hypothetical protein